MSRRIITGLTCAAFTLGGGAFIAGCGDDNNDSGSAASTPAATDTPATTADAGGAVAISMKGSKFSPETITAKVGQKVTWTNDDGYAHNVIATAGEDFKSKNFATGTFDYTLDKAGEIKYVCTLHQNMVGTITVTQ